MSDQPITALSQLDTISKVITDAELGIAPKYREQFVCLVFDTKSAPAVRGDGQAPLVYLLVDDAISHGWDSDKPVVERHTFRELRNQIKISIRESYNSDPELKYVDRQVLLNTLELADSEDIDEARNATEEEIDKLLWDSFEQNASDIHISVGERAGETFIKYRIDGELVLQGTERNQLNTHEFVSVLYGSLAAKSGSVKGIGFQSMEKLDGVIYRSINEKRLGARIASHPTEKKEKSFYMVLRVLGDQNEYAERIQFEKLGFLFNQGEKVQRSISGKGLILIIGETNSGKSVTMANLLMSVNEVSAGTRNIMSIENPIERQIKGVTQFSLIDSGTTTRQQMEMAYENISEYVVRADIDDVAIGEIRDPLSCQIGVQLGRTGHNIMATMHCDDPFDVFDRMVGLKQDKSSLRTNNIIKTVISQKLFKKLCPHCSLSPAQVDHLSKEQLSALREISFIGLEHKIGKVRFRNLEGCEKCRGRGIRGRQLVAEVAEFSSQIVHLLANNQREDAFKSWLFEKNYTKKDIALANIFAGTIDPTEAIDQLRDLITTYLFREQHNIPHPAEIYK